MPTRRYFTNNAPQQTLNASITSSATTCVISGSFSGWPTQFPYFAELDYGTASAEIVLVTNVSGTTATITRGQGGTAAISHAAGATLDHVAVAQDLDEANAHTSASTGVHGVSGGVVGTSDAQTLTNKTLAAPVFTGTATGASATFTGTVQQATSDTTGADTAGSYTANGNGAVTGVLVPKTYTNEAAASAALPSPPVGATVWLSAPTTGGTGAGLFQWNGSVWQPAAGMIPFFGESSSAVAVTLSTTSIVAGSGSITFTLAQQMRVKISVLVQFTPASATAGRYYAQPAYNTGSSVVIGSAVFPGRGGLVSNDGTTNVRSLTAFGTALLAAGTYTAYPAVARSLGGSATDTANVFYTTVEGIGLL